jgi:uncharacterized protein (DUF2267 family)
MLPPSFDSVMYKVKKQMEAEEAARFAKALPDIVRRLESKIDMLTKRLDELSKGLHDSI